MDSFCKVLEKWVGASVVIMLACGGGQGDRTKIMNKSEGHRTDELGDYD